MKSTFDFKGKNAVYVWYTIVFLLALPLAFYVFIRDGKSLAWKTDAVPLYINSLKYLGRTIRQCIFNLFSTGKLEMPMYDFNIGFGTDTMSWLSTYHLEPLNFLSVFVKATYTEYLYNFLVVVRIYLAGLTFLIYCNYQNWDKFASLCGSFVYIFSGFVLWAGVRHPVFLMPVIMLPLACMYVEKIIHEEKIKYFFALILISFVGSWYLTYIYTVVLGVYFLISYFAEKKEKRISFWKAVFEIVKNYFLGFGCAAIVLFPAIISFIKCNRTNSKVEWTDLLTYGKGWTERLFSYMFSQSADPGYWVKINALVIAFFCLVFLFLKTRETKWKMQWIGFTVCLLIPAFGFATSGFSVINNRWSFAYSFILACIVAIVLPKLKELTQRERLISFIILLLYIGLIIKSGDYSRKWLSYEIILLLITYVAILLASTQTEKKYIFLYKTGCIVLILGNIALNAYIRYDEGYANYASEFADRGQALALITESSVKPAKNIADDQFYRVEYEENSYMKGNWGMYLYENPTSFTFNEIDKYVEQFFLDNEIEDYSTKVAIMGLDNRSALMELFAVKYHIPQKNSVFIPADYTIVSEKNDDIYQNQNSLSLGYTYNQYMSNEQYYSLSSIDRQYAMLDAVLINETVLDIKQSEQRFDRADMVEIGDIEYKDLTWSGEEEKLVANKKNASICIKIPAASEKAEYYVRLADVNVDNLTSESLNLTFRVQQQEKAINFKSSKYTYYTGRDNVIVYLGTYAEEEVDCEIIFPKKGTYGLGDIEIYTRPTDDLEEMVSQLKKEELENVEIGTNQITGDITVSEDKFLCFSIPYSTGWTVYVDGEEEKLIRANTMFMGVMLEEGEHDIELKYVTPGLRAGACVSLISFLIVGVSMWKRKKKNSVIV